MPMKFVGQITTIFRTISRFALFVMFGLCVLAAFALSELLPRLRRNPRLLVVAAARRHRHRRPVGRNTVHRLHGDVP